MPDPTPHRCDNCDGIDPGSCINADTPRPDDVPDEWIELTAAAICNNDNHGVTWDKVRSSTAERYRRLATRTLNAVAPLIARQVREQVAAEIEARVAEHRATAARLDEGDRADRLEAIGWHAKADHLQEGAEIARGEGR